jgi:hypothetical protein
VRKKHQYIENLRRRQEAARGQQAAETPKPVNQMSEAELDAEAERLRADIRASKARSVEAQRQELAGQGSKHPIFARKKRRPPWK